MKKTKWNVMLLLLLTLLTCSACNGNDRPAEKPTPTGKVTQAPAETMTPTTSPIYSAEFDSFTEQLFLNDIAANTINLHYTLAYPENYGITEYAISLGDGSYSSMLAGYSGMRELKNELLEFEYGELSAKQQFTYDIMMDYLDAELSAEELVLYMEFFGPTTGYQAQLPVVLAEYTFRREQDVKDYLELLCVIDDTFEGMVEFEQKKSEAGLFMSDATLEDILDQCRQFIENPEENYMIDVFRSKLDEVDWLTREQKEEYNEKHEELIRTEVVGAYQLLIDGLSALAGTGTNELGLSYYEKGKEYYEYLTYTATGSEKSPAELAVAIPQVIYEAIADMQTIMQSDPGAMDEWETYEFCETDPAAILLDLQKKIESVFPNLPEVTYQIKYVHPSMQEHMSPAFYLTPPIDDLVNNVIYINPAYESGDLYVTMAHEGFPGHLYQTVYTASKDLPLVRNLFNYNGYTEGWAQYVEFMAYEMGGLDENLAKILKYNSIAIMGIHAAIDIGVHYYGWGVDEVESFLYSYGLGTREAAESVFDYVVAEPSNYLSYFVGYMEFTELQKTAEETWGEAYSDTLFYDVVLSLGPAPFPLLEEQIISLK